MDKKYFVLKSLKGPSLLTEKPSEQVIISRSGGKNEGGVLGKIVGGVPNQQDQGGTSHWTNTFQCLCSPKLRRRKANRRKHAGNKSVAIPKQDMRKLTPTPDLKSKYHVAGKFVKLGGASMDERANKSLPMEGVMPPTAPLPRPTGLTPISSAVANSGVNNLPAIRPIGLSTGKKGTTEPGSLNQTGTIKVATRLLNVNNDRDRDSIVQKYRGLVKSPQVDHDRLFAYLALCIRGLHYSTQCLKEPSKKFINSRKLRLDEPKQRRRHLTAARTKTLYLDLDETIIFQIKDPNHPATFEMPTETGEKVRCGDLELRVAARPHWQIFLDEMSALYEIVVFTASTFYYATLVTKALDPEGKYFNGLLSRNHCLMTKNGFFIKDLRMIENRELKDVVLLDNYVHSFAFNLDNGIPILEWRGESSDDELLHMMEYLREVAKEPDVREVNRRRLGLANIPKQTSIA